MQVCSIIGIPARLCKTYRKNRVVFYAQEDAFSPNASRSVRQPSMAHFTRAGIWETSRRAEASSRLSISSSLASPRIMRKGPVGDGIAIELELELNFVAAARVHAVEHEVGVRQIVLELRADVVLGEDLVVERISRHSPCAP